jgi:hypothetical protein
MAVEIDELNTQVRVTSPASAVSGAGRGPTPASGGDQSVVCEALRPIVRQILTEELEAIMRTRGIR